MLNFARKKVKKIKDKSYKLIKIVIIIDFNRSSIDWHGEFSAKLKLVSKISFYKSLNKKITYALGQSVMAGNVYNKHNLIKKPYYIFQLLGNHVEQKLL